jgi:hypothetical protein
VLSSQACRQAPQQRKSESGATVKRDAPVGEVVAARRSIGQFAAGGTYSIGDLQGMNLGELSLLAQQLRALNTAQSAQAAQLAQTNPTLCKLLEQRQSACSVLQPLVAKETDLVLQCSGSYQNRGSSTAPLKVNLRTSATGSFVLIANEAFVSSPFASGSSSISFSPLPGTEAVVPRVMDISKLALRSSPGLQENELSPLPAISGLSFTLSSGELVLAQEPLMQSDDGALRTAQSEYLVDLTPLAKLASSSLCTFSPQDIQRASSGTSVSAAVAAQNAAATQAATKLEVGADHTERQDLLIAEILQLQQQIAARTPELRAAQGLNSKLSKHLTEDSARGCYANQPITSFAIELEGKIAGAEGVGTFAQPQQYTAVSGSPTAMSFNFGSFNFTVDLAQTNVFGARYELPSDISKLATIGSIDRVVLNKLGVDFRNIRSCEKKYLILYEECNYTTSEESSFVITGLRVYANGQKIYASEGINVLLNRNQLEISFNDLFANPFWLKVMQATTCTSAGT